MPETNPLMILVCIVKGHEWRLLTRYSWALRTRLLVCERCSVCGGRRPLSLLRDCTLAR